MVVNRGIEQAFLTSGTVCVRALNRAGPRPASLVVQSVKNPPDNEFVDLIPGSGRSPWRRKEQPTPVFLPWKFHGQSSLVD